ncbi:mitogen-activated protein kinase kinase kinase 18-like [Bidens hawaiensis]|uniref:mitogen-activated protein kinase kinase kinase 18-like n=1 Tax=Bidens hawaiensis TaxID=980011 RepID=UPI004049BC2D
MKWTRGPVIGRGSSATVYLATTATGDRFAVKSCNLSTSISLQQEQHILSQLNSPYIISYKGYDITSYNNMPMYNIHMEYATRGTVSDVIKKHGGSLHEDLIRCYTYQILLGLDYLHLNKLVHCDIKCGNILVCDDNVNVKIGDLGCAKLADNNNNNMSKFSGTPVFMAPEVVRGEEQGFAADVWALGCVIIEMATGCNPWPDVNDPISGLYRIGYSGEVPEFPRWLSPECQDFLNVCLKRDAKERYSIQELLKHPFVVNLDMGFGKVEEFTKNSPTSVLNQDFWGRLEVAETSPETTRNVGFSGDSPEERIMQLVKGGSLCLPNWRDEDWIMIRSE